jgi:predicted AlkP superfamily pyrophosphatase or phosphodiesterase
MFTGHPTPEAAAAAPVYLAAHGHAPSLEQLHAAFLMAGPGVREGTRLGEVSMLDLAPTAAALLGLTLPAAEGRPLAEALVTPPPGS